MTGLSVCQMGEDELKDASDELILIGTAIVGCDLPFTAAFSETISEQIISFIKGFGYEEFTIEEIILAFKFNLHVDSAPDDSDCVSFTGRCMNVSFVAKILSRYKKYRIYLDRKIQNLIDGYK